MQKAGLKGELPKILVSSLQGAGYRPRTGFPVRPALMSLLRPRPCALCPAPVRLPTPPPPPGIALRVAGGQGRGRGRFSAGAWLWGRRHHEDTAQIAARRADGPAAPPYAGNPSPRDGGGNCSCLRRLYRVPICRLWKEGGGVGGGKKEIDGEDWLLQACFLEAATKPPEVGWKGPGSLK